MPTGLKNSPDLNRPVRGPQPFTTTSQLIFKATNVPQTFPAFYVPSGASVALRGVNGSTANAQPAYVADNISLLTGANRRTITPDTEISFPTDGLNKIWCMGTAGDGVQATINGYE